MKYISKENFDKIINTFGGRQLTLETQKEIIDFMSKELMRYDTIYRLDKRAVKALAKMKCTAQNPKNSPNWANTLSDGSQIVWNRKSQMFYHLKGSDIITCGYYDWLSLFPEIEMTKDLEWLIDNMCDCKFERTMSLLLSYKSGIICKYNYYITL